MIVKILGSLDLIAGLLFWIFALFGIIPSSIISFLALYLVIKSIIFLISEHFASALDLISGIIIFSSLAFNLPDFIAIIISLYLIQKGIFSIIS